MVKETEPAMNPDSPREVDEALAKEHHALAAVERSQQSLTGSARFVYGGGRKARFAEATTPAREIWSRVEAAAANGDEYQLTIGKRPTELLAERARLSGKHAEVRERIDALEALYTGWSRFFLVTSSPGHVHSSMHCHSCYATTTYGWLPELSGHSEAQAVDQLGDTLCSVCFPSLRQGKPKKITKARALALAA